MNRETIVRILRETAALLELKGENPFRVRAYENGARTLSGLAEEPEDLLERGTLAEIPGIGPGLVGVIAEIVQTGRSTLHEQLRCEMSPGLLELLRIGGLGPKRIRLLFQRLGIESAADLERACREDRVAPLPGFGAKTQQRILDGLAQLDRYRDRHLLSDAWPAAASALEHLVRHPAVRRAEIAGSLRRWRETIGDIDLVAAVEEPERAAVAAHFAATPGRDRTIAAGDTKVSIVLVGGLQVDLRMVAQDEFATALHHSTGSREHNVALRGRAQRMGLSINEYGLFRGEERLPVTSEAELYRALGLAWIAPELREGLDEIERAEAGTLPALAELADLRGTFHVHTSWSDGTASIPEMAAAAAARGWEYLGIADHSRAAAYAGGLQPERVREQWREIDAWNAENRRPHLFKGTEVDILVDGTLDFPDELLAGFDYVVASVHSRFRLDAETMTARLVRAVAHPCVTFLGHPTGRLLLAREGYAFDEAAVLEAAFANGVVIELNASPHRLDVDWRVLRGWLARGGRTSVHPDAHAPAGLDDVRYGVAIARKAGARRSDLVNTGSLGEVRALLAARRERAASLLAGGTGGRG